MKLSKKSTPSFPLVHINNNASLNTQYENATYSAEVWIKIKIPILIKFHNSTLIEKGLTVTRKYPKKVFLRLNINPFYNLIKFPRINIKYLYRTFWFFSVKVLGSD